MNSSTAVFLFSEEVRTVSCTFAINQPGTKVYTYKTLLQGLQVDDLVVVECQGTSTQHGFAVVKVVAMDPVIDMMDTTINYKWVMSKVDTSAHADLLKREQALAAAMQEAHRRKAREEVRAQLIAELGEETVKQITF